MPRPTTFPNLPPLPPEGDRWVLRTKDKRFFFDGSEDIDHYDKPHACGDHRLQYAAWFASQDEARHRLDGYENADEYEAVPLLVAKEDHRLR